MIEIIEGMPDNILGILAKGEVTRKDYLEVVIPAVDKALKRNAKLRFYYDMGSQFTGIDFGAEWEDFKIGIDGPAADIEPAAVGKWLVAA